LKSIEFQKEQHLRPDYGKITVYSGWEENNLISGSSTEEHAYLTYNPMKELKRKNHAVAIMVLFFILASCSEETPQWRGPERNGIYSGKGLMKKWPDGGPPLLLKINDIGIGVSQPVMYKNKIYVTGVKNDSMDFISAYDLKGVMLWDKSYGRAWERTYPDSRCTPTIEKNRIYLISGMGDLACMNARDGSIIWSKNPHEEFAGKYMHWGIAESVLLTGDAALYTTGGKETTVVAFDKRTGELLWKTRSTGASRSYASSSLIEWNGLEIALIQTSHELMGIDAGTGEILWSHNTRQYHKSKRGTGEAANTPLCHDGDIFVTYGNEQLGSMFSLSEDGRSVNLKWQNDILDTHHGGLVLHEGNIYGSNMQDNRRGKWVSVDWETGKTHWESEWYTKGSVISADGMLYFYDERDGNVALVQPDAGGFRLISSFRVEEGSGPHWAHPSIYKDMLLIRHGNVLLVYDIKD
jgi:outer membrane protein assembly factor BamB